MTRTRRDAGFTLVELLVVIVILGALVGLAVFASGGQGRELRQEAQRLAALIGVLSEEAVLDNREYGLRFERQGYQVLRHDPLEDRWEPVEPAEVRRLPEWIRLELRLDGAPLRLSAPAPGRNASSAQPQPQLLLLSSGELSPFTLELADRQGDAGRWQLDSDGFNPPQARQVQP